MSTSEAVAQMCPLKGAPNNFTKFAENRLCQGLFFELQAEACNLIKKETDTDVFL